MDITEFWSLIEAARELSAASSDDNGKAVSAALVDRLAATSALAIFEFEQYFAQLHTALDRWDVWAAAYLINSGCSDDSFMDFRAGLIAQGRAWYERAADNPDVLAEHPDVIAVASGERESALFQELVNYIASYAYKEFMGECEEDEFYEAYDAFTGPIEPGPAEMGEDFDFADPAQMQSRLPRLAAMFPARR